MLVLVPAATQQNWQQTGNSGYTADVPQLTTVAASRESAGNFFQVRPSAEIPDETTEHDAGLPF